MAPTESDAFPTTIDISRGVTMTFLRNQPYLSRVEIKGSDLTLPESSLVVPPHWHETHDELFQVVQGRVEFTIGDSKRIYTPEDGEIRIPKGSVHSIKAFKGEDLVWNERTDPMDDGKELFFRNLLVDGPPTNVFLILRVCYVLDMRPAFPGHFKWFEKAFVTVFGGFVAPLLGYNLKYSSLEKQD